ncbi:MAG: hypothetical protein RPU61_00345 [Candidatus Sedimenticola sp. (ex Thyasira tokunagai)]
MISTVETALRGGFFYPEKVIPILLICITGIVYWPGLPGPFLLDDAQLGVISEISSIDNFRSLWRYLTSDLSGLFGRPISNLTFLANYSSWPTSPFPFKATNLAIHLLIGGMLYQFIKTLLGSRKSPHHGDWTALIVTAYWLLNPFNVSTTLYVIQRMAMLSALFVVAGLTLYTHGRKLQAEGNQRGYIWMTMAIILFTSLAILSKENGALLPILALTLEYTVMRHYLKLPSPHQLWSLTFLWLPSLVLALALAYYGSPTSYSERAFTLAERVFTECRVLLEYAYYWFNPFAVSRGVLASDYPLSTGLLTPWTTLPALLAIIASILWAIWQRQRHPLAALAILFYFAGHILESTVIPLEIYFEHRNYLPAIFLVLPLAHWATKTHSIGKGRWLPLLVIVILCTQALQTFRLTKVWGNELALAAWWSHHNPEATRAQDFFATSLSSIGRPDLGLQVLEDAIQRTPENSHYYLHSLYEECKFTPIKSDRLIRLEKQLSRFPISKKSYPLLKNILGIAASGKCNGLSTTEASTLVAILANHPNSRRDRDGYGQLMHIRGLALLLDRQPEKAVESFGQSLRYRSNIQTGLEQVGLLGTHSYYELALSWLDHVALMPRPTSLRGVGRAWDIDVEIEHLRTQLNKDMATPAIK